jgi:Ca2+-binding RTX toxin-like protein
MTYTSKITTTPAIVINGTIGDDVFKSVVGTQEWFFGGAGDDIFELNASDGDWANGGAGNDLIYATANAGDPLAGDGIRGNGGDGLDILLGSRGNDILNGGADNDRLGGQGGSDQLWGGSGADIFYASPTYSGGAFGNIAVVRDYSLAEGDSVRLAFDGSLLQTQYLGNYVAPTGIAFGSGILLTSSANPDTGFFVTGATDVSQLNIVTL